MPLPIPRADETGFLGFAILSEVIDLLVEKGVVTKGEITFLLSELAERPSKDTRAASQRGANVIRNTMLGDV